MWNRFGLMRCVGKAVKDIRPLDHQWIYIKNGPPESCLYIVEQIMSKKDI